MLGHWGLRTLAVDSGAKALATLDRSANAGQPISLLISDLHMPEMDGFELIEAIRRHAQFNLLPVVLLTSSASPGDQKRCEELRVAARLLKPAKQSLLLDNVLRILSGQTHDRAPARVLETPASTDAATGASLRVLLAEDNPVNVKFALKLLERAGHQVVVAGNGKQAVDHWSAGTFDVILMDVQMPEMDGLDATRAIRKTEQERDGGRIPIIAMTANAMAGDREMCIDAGMDGYVAKPVKKEALFAEIGRLVVKGGEHAAGV
jgi:CheY-like chemotaxis protein